MEEVTPSQSETFTDDNQGVLETVRLEADAHPPLVELGRALLAKAQDGDTEAVRDLMRHGAPFTTDWLGTSAIHWACQLNHFETAELLLKAGISRDARNKVDRTPLHVTAQEGHIQILKLLLDHGVDVDAVDMLQMTPLHWAAEYGHEECVRLLLEHGADPEAINKFDKTADQIAFDNNRLDITHIIQEYAENPLREARRKAAKEKQKQAAAAHKAALEQEKACRSPPKSFGEVEKVVRVMKLAKRKTTTPRVVFENVVDQTTQAVPEPVQADEDNTEKTLAMLQAHGITMLPNDDSTTVESAVQSGHKVVLTEAGKMALNLTEAPTVTTGPIKVPILKLPELLKGKRVITIRADQLINMKKQQKVIIQTDKNNPSAPLKIINPLFPPKGRPPKTNAIYKVQPKTPVEVLVTKKLVNNETKLTASYVQKQSVEESEVKRLKLMLEDTRQQLENARVELRIQKGQEEELRNQLNLLKGQFSRKEKEAEDYKKMVELLKNNN